MEVKKVEEEVEIDVMDEEEPQEVEFEMSDPCLTPLQLPLH